MPFGGILLKDFLCLGLMPFDARTMSNVLRMVRKLSVMWWWPMDKGVFAWGYDSCSFMVETIVTFEVK